MAKPDLGTKRLCAGCGAKFYDLNRTPIVCPKCETEFVPVVVAPRTRPDTPKPVPVAETIVPETTDAEFVSLEDAEAEEQGGKKTAPPALTARKKMAGSRMPPSSRRQEEAGSADVSDIVGDGVEKEEES